MIKNVLYSDEANDVLKGIKGDNYYVFEGDYGNDTVRTKGTSNTFQFNELTSYYFTAKGNDLIMHTESFYKEVEEEFYYNGEFTTEQNRTANNIAVKDLYIVDGQLSETGSEDQLVGDNDLYEIGTGTQLYKYNLNSVGTVFASSVDSSYIALDDSDKVLYADSSGNVYYTENSAYTVVAPGTPLYAYQTPSYKNSLVTIDAEKGDFIGVAPGEYVLGNVYYNPTTGAITTEQVEGSLLLTDDLYYNTITKQITVGTTNSEGDIILVDKNPAQYWDGNQLSDSPTHQEENKRISDLYLVNGEICETGDPSQRIGDKILYKDMYGYYTTDLHGTTPEEIEMAGTGTIRVKNFLKGKTDISVDFGEYTGESLADLVNNVSIIYDKSNATKKQTIKAHTKWNSTIIGSDFSDKIYGSRYDDCLYGGSGNDRIYTRTGYEEVYAGIGDDKIYLNGKGEKYVDGGEGNDKIYVTAKNVHANINGGAGDDRIYIKKSVIERDPDENSILYFEEDSGNDTVAISKKVDVSHLELYIDNFDSDSTFTKSGNSLIITSGEDSVKFTNYFKKGYNVSSIIFEGQTLADWIKDVELLTTSNSKTTKGTNFTDVITTGAKVRTVNAYNGDDVIISSYQKMTVNGGDGDDTFKFYPDNVDNYTVLFDIAKEGDDIGNALYVVADDAKKLSYGITLKNVEIVEVNGEEYAPTPAVIESVQSWLNDSGYDSVADAISDKCNIQELIAAFNPDQSL